MIRATNPDHKARVRRGVQYVCSCGWESSMWFGKGATGNASAEWHNHRDKCEAGS